LDIGCRDGLFSFKAESMVAGEVIGIDNDLSEPATQFLIPFFNSKIQMKQLNLYEILPDTFGLFDVVIFPGVLYHLRYPFWGLKVIRDITNIGAHLLIEPQFGTANLTKRCCFVQLAIHLPMPMIGPVVLSLTKKGSAIQCNPWGLKRLT